MDASAIEKNENVDIIHQNGDCMTIDQIYGVLWYHEELLFCVCKMLSLFQGNVSFLNELNDEWKESIEKSVQNKDGTHEMIDGMVYVMDFVIKCLLESFIVDSNKNGQTVENEKIDQTQENVNLVILVQNEIDKCLQWIKKHDIEKYQRLSEKWKLIRLYVMIFSSYQQRIQNLNKQEVEVINHLRLVQKYLTQFHNKVTNNNEDDNDRVQFDSPEILIALYLLHQSISKEIAIITKDNNEVFNYIIQEYIGSFAFPAEIKADNSNININFVLYLCDVMHMSNYRGSNETDEKAEKSILLKIRFSECCNNYTIQLIADTLLIVFKNEQLPIVINPTEDNKQPKQLQRPTPVTLRLNEILETEEKKAENNNTQQPKQYSRSALALVIAEETFQHNNAPYLKQTEVVSLKQIKLSGIAKKLEKSDNETFCHKIVAIGAAKALTSSLISKWDKIEAKSAFDQTRYRIVLARLFGAPIGRAKSKKQVPRLSKKLLDLKRGLGYYFFIEYCRKYGWYNAKHDWIEMVDTTQNVCLLKKIKLESMMTDARFQRGSKKTTNEWLKDNVFCMLWSRENVNDNENERNENLFMDLNDHKTEEKEGKSEDDVNRDLMKRLDEQIYQAINGNIGIKVKAKEVKQKHLVGLIGSIFRHAFLIEAFRNGQQNLLNTGKFVDQCKRSINNPLFNIYSAGIKETLLFSQCKDETFSCSWNETRNRQTIFNKQLMCLAIHLFGVCISIKSNPFGKLLDIDANMNDEFIIGMPDNYSSTSSGHGGDSIFICENKHLFFNSDINNCKTEEKGGGEIRCNMCSAASRQVGTVTVDGFLKLNPNHGLEKDNLQKLQWIERELGDEKNFLRGYVISKKENVDDRGGQRELSELGVYVLRLFVNLILWMMNVHCDKNGGVNPIKYLLCNVPPPSKKTIFAKLFGSNPSERGKEAKYPKSIEGKGKGNELKRTIWDMKNEEVSKWLLKNEIRFYYALIKRELMRSDEDILYVLHCIIDRFYHTWDDCFGNGYDGDVNVDTSELIVRANESAEILKEASLVSNSLRKRDQCEDYFMKECINPVLFDINQNVKNLRHVSSNDKFIRFWNKRSDYERDSGAWCDVQNEYYPYLWLPYKKINLTQFYLHLQKQEKEKTTMNGQYSITYGLLFSINNQNCGNLVYYLQYLPDMIKWTKFIYLRCNGRLTKKDLTARRKENENIYKKNAQWLLDECRNDIVNGGQDVANEHLRALSGFVKVWNFFAQRDDQMVNNEIHSEIGSDDDFEDDDHEYSKEVSLTSVNKSRDSSNGSNSYDSNSAWYRLIGTSESGFLVRSLSQIHRQGLMMLESTGSMNRSDAAFDGWPLFSIENLAEIPLIVCICGDININDGNTIGQGASSGFDTLMDDQLGASYDVNSIDKLASFSTRSRLPIGMILERLVSVSNNVLQACLSSSKDTNSGMLLSHIEKRSDVIDIDENELQHRVQKCTQQQASGGSGSKDNYVNKGLLEADLMKRYLIGRKPIINDYSKNSNYNKNSSNDNSIFDFRLLGSMSNLRERVGKIEESSKKYKDEKSPFFERMSNELLTTLTNVVKMQITTRLGMIDHDKNNNTNATIDMNNKKKRKMKASIIEMCECYKSGIEQTILRIERMTILPWNNCSLYDFMTKEVKLCERQTNIFCYNSSCKQDIRLKHCLHLWNVFCYFIKINNQDKWNSQWIKKEIKSKLQENYKVGLTRYERENIKMCIRHLFATKEFGDIKVFEFILQFRCFIFGQLLSVNRGNVSLPLNATKFENVSLMQCLETCNPSLSQDDKNLFIYLAKKFKKIVLGKAYFTYITIVDQFEKLHNTL